MTLDTSTQVSKSNSQSINVIKKSRNEVIRTIQEITKVDEDTINQAIEACQDSEGRYSMDTVLNILMDEKYSNEQKSQKSENSRYSRQYGTSPSSNDDSNKFLSPTSKRNYHSNTNDKNNSFSQTNNIDEDDDDDYDQITNYSSSRSDHIKSRFLESDFFREENKPCGLKNIGNTCWFNSIIQSLFHLPGFRQIIFSFELSDIEISKIDEKNKNMILFVAELRKLFALMLKSKRKVINPEPTLKCLKNCSKYDSELLNQEDVSEFMTILVNIIEESFEILNNLKQAQQKENQQQTEDYLVSKLNEGLNLKSDLNNEELKAPNLKKNRKNPIVNLLDGEIIVKRKNSEDKSESEITDIFREVNIQMLNSRNLHAGLELEWGETLIDKQIPTEASRNSTLPQTSIDNKPISLPIVNRSIYQQESWVKTLPRVLFFCLNRYKFIQATQSSSKILEPFEFYQHIFLDRYMDVNKEIIKQKRKELKVFKNELKLLEDKLSSIKEYKNSESAFALDEALKTVLHFVKTDYSNDEVFKKIKPVNKNIELETSNAPETDEINSLNIVESCLKNWINRTEEKIADLNESIQKIKNKIDTAFDEEELKKNRYNLHSVCIHEGSSTSGHFWTYIWNPKQNKWYKYNDTEVCETTWEDVYANSIGGSTQANLNQLNDLNNSKKIDATMAKNENDLSTKSKSKPSDRIPSAYFLIYTKADDSSLYQENNVLGADIQEFLKYDLNCLDNKLKKLKYKKILDDANELLKKTNDQIVQNSNPEK